MNLVENAMKYGGSGLRSIRVGADENSREYIISIKDDGKGLKKMDNFDIFQPFERLDGSCKIKGTGLGLAIVKEMVEKHGGDVWYDSGDKKGATFYASISKSI
jgi:signal transduction histidine kinase